MYTLGTNAVVFVCHQDSGNGRNGGCAHDCPHRSSRRVERTASTIAGNSSADITATATVNVGRPRLERHPNGGDWRARRPTRRGGDGGHHRRCGGGGVMHFRGENTTAASRTDVGARRFGWYACVAALAVLAAAAPTTASPADDADDGGPVAAAHRCGTLPYQPLVGTKGVITTPQFPGPFPVPIECEWVIQADAAADAMIEVYFTQLFVTDGLTITEYSQYPVDFGFVTVREVFNKSHITQYGQSMLSTLPYVVIRFQLDRLQGNHIRVHDDLMDVYGFNITYEMRPAGNERSDVCSLYHCSYSGNCLGNADLT